MQNLLSFFSHLDIRSTLEGTIKRFPLPTILVLIISGLWFYQTNYELHNEWLYRLIITSIVCFFFSTGLAILSESSTKNKYIELSLNILPILFGLMFYNSLYGVYDATIDMVTYILLTLSGFISFVLVAPFLQTYISTIKENNTHFYNYFIQISWVFLMSFVVGLSLLALGATAIASVIALFDIKTVLDEGKLYANWAIFSLSLIAPLYGLIHLPIKTEYSQTLYIENKFFSFLIRYIATPFIYIYFIILYAYSIKVLVNFSEWPKGMISWMVIGFSTFGYLIYIFSRAYEFRSNTVGAFRKYFSYFVLPQVCMLFYAIYLRINQYDLTMNRYFVVVFGIWLVTLSLYYIVSKSKHLSFIPASLLIIILIISVGPWSVYSLPLKQQYNRLVSNLEKTHILQNSKIVPLNNVKDISKELSNEIYSEIEYVCDFGDCKLIKDLFKKEIEDATIQDRLSWEKNNTITGATYSGIKKWTITAAITEKIKVQASYSYENSTIQKYIQYNTNYEADAPYPITITGTYAKIVRVYGEKDIPSKAKYPYIVINSDSGTTTYYVDIKNTIPLQFNTPKKLIDTTTPPSLDQSDLTFIAKGKGIEARLLLQNYAIKNPNYTSNESSIYYNNSGIALIKESR